MRSCEVLIWAITSDCMERLGAHCPERLSCHKRRSVAIFMVAAGWSLDFLGDRDSRSGHACYTSPPLTESRGLSLFAKSGCVAVFDPGTASANTCSHGVLGLGEHRNQQNLGKGLQQSSSGYAEPREGPTMLQTHIACWREG